MEKPSNIKTDSWYEEYIKLQDHIIYADKIDDDLSLKQRIELLKDMDQKIIVFNQINEHVTPFKEQMKEAQKIMDPFYKDYNHLPFQERNKKLMSFDFFVKAKNQHEEAYNNFYKNIPPGVSKRDFEYYHLIIRGKVSRNDDLIFNCNSLEKNKGLLEILKYRINSVKLQPDINKLESYIAENEDRCILFTKAILELCEKALSENYLVTATLEDILYDIKAEEYNDYYERKRKHSKTISDLYFRDFSYNESQIFELIRKNEKWHDINRDIEIFQERKKGIYLDELAERYGFVLSNISMIVKKVQGSVNFWKGKLFENYVEKKLKESNLFEKVIKEAGKGEADILAYTKDNKLYIYSIKNLKIKRKPYWLTKDELRPELKRALLQSLDYQVQLVLLVFDNYHSIVKQFLIDSHNPENINLAGD